MPDMIPVGNTGVQQDPLGSISKIIGLQSAQIGLQQQRQNLQTGQYQQQTAQAEAQGAQRIQAEQQAAQQLMINGTKPGGKYVINQTDPATGKVTSTLDRQAMANDIQTVAPTSGQQIAGSLLSQANEIVQNRQAVMNLSTAKREQIGNAVGALAADPTVDHSKLIDTLEGLRKQYPDDGDLSRMLQSFGSGVPPSAQGPQLQQILNTAAATMKGTPAIQPATNAASQNIIRSTYSGALNMPPGSAPNPTGPQVTGAAARQTGTASSDVDRANQVSANVKSAPATIQTSQQIDDLADQIHSGKFVDAISKAAAAVGMKDDTYARQLLKKDLGIIQTQLTAAAPSDSRAATILSGTPDATSDPQTIHGAMDYVRGAARQNLAQGQNKNAYQAKHPDLGGFQQADDAFTSAAGPLVHEFLSLKTPAEQSQFYRRNFTSAQQALQFRNQARAASHTLGIGQ
jgi:hypothetical protein